MKNKTWIYRVIERDFQTLSEKELNEVGAYGWELVNVVICTKVAVYHFKKLKD
jgi:hypothetical protein